MFRNSVARLCPDGCLGAVEEGIPFSAVSLVYPIVPEDIAFRPTLPTTGTPLASMRIRLESGRIAHARNSVASRGAVEELVASA